MPEQNIVNGSCPESYSFETSQSIKPNTDGLHKIVSIGYGSDQSQRLPICRYSLKVSVIGLGSTGTVASIGLSALGHTVTVIDHDPHKVDSLNQGKILIEEPKLATLLTAVKKTNNLMASGDLHNGMLSSDLTLVCVGTSSLQKLTLKTKALYRVCKQIGVSLRYKNSFHAIVICQPFTTKADRDLLAEEISKVSGKVFGSDFGLSFLPLKLSEQNALTDFYSFTGPITSNNQKSIELTTKLFNGFSGKIRHSIF